MASKHERELVAHLTQASQDVYAGERWPYPAPVPQYHPDWCCEHQKYRHHEGKRWPIPFCNGCAVDEELGKSERAETEHTYLKGRDWAIDAAYPSLKVAVEYEGIVWAKKGGQVGRHQTGAGMTADLAKYGWLVEHGWTVVRVGQRQVTSGEALRIIQAALQVAASREQAMSRLAEVLQEHG